MLFIVGTPLGNLKDITLRALDTLKEADLILCEDTRTSSKLLNKYAIRSDLMAYHEHNAEKVRPHIVERLHKGEKIALITDAGMPLVSDPGYKLVTACQKEKLSYTVIPGPTAPISALCLSGLSPDKFLFGGFLPNKQAARRKTFYEFENLEATLIFFESPRRLVSSLEDALYILGNRKASVCREITKLFEEANTSSLSELIIHYTKNSPKGEIVLLIEGHTHNTASIDVDGALKNALLSYKTREAASIVAEETGLSKRDLYARALILQKEEV